MCSISRNQTADEQLAKLERSNKKHRTDIEKKLVAFARSASIQQAGPLDDTSCHLQGFPADLKSIRRRRIGRHRVFYTGQHTTCAYEAIYVKAWKKKGVEDENDHAFRQHLRRALDRPTVGRLPNAEDDDEHE
ncbi:MAG: hypothetical protein ACRD2L_16850 [Terriglobia bacterium]